MLTLELGRLPVEGERIFLREPHDLNAYAHLSRGQMEGDTVWFGCAEMKTIRDLDAWAAEAIESHRAVH